MAVNIDWTFIARLEGAGIRKGYVPNPAASQSGVTIATGFDLGQRTREEIAAMDLSPDLKAKLMPYVGLRGRDALGVVAGNPLILGDDEVAAIDRVVRAQFATRLAVVYDGAIDGETESEKFEDLPGVVQTVIASVAYQYGLNLKVRAPRFWVTLTEQDWSAAVAELRNFGDAYATRRTAEANLLATAIA